MENTLTVTLKVQANLDLSRLVRDCAQNFFLTAKTPEKWARRLVLVLDELYMNAVRYGSAPTSFVTCTFTSTPERISFTIQDQGEGKLKVKAEDLRQTIQQKANALSHKQTSGRGLALITSAWSDGYEIRNASPQGIEIEVYKNRANMPTEQTPPPQTKPEQTPTPTPKPTPTPTPQPEKPTQPSTPLPRKTIPLKGEIDEINLQEQIEPIQELLAEETPYEIILDFTELKYFNSLFIGFLATFQKETQDLGGRLIIIGPHQEAREILDLCGLSEIIPIYDTIKQVK